MSMRDTHPIAGNLHETAAEWHLRLRAETESEAVLEAFRTWMEADPEHRLAYADVCAAAFACEQITDISPHAGIRPGVVASGGPPRPLRQSATVTTRRYRRAFVAVALAASLLAAVLAPGALIHLRADLVGTPGLVLQHTLEDGSTLRLDGDSAVRVRYDQGYRRIELLRGALHVEVQRDPARPFQVLSEDLEARALGTRYAVSRLPTLHRVAVDSGRVAVRRGDGDAVELGAGQALVSGPAGTDFEIGAAGTGDLGWLSDQLVFSATPFEDAIALMARHLGERVVVSRGVPVDPVTAVAPIGEARQLLERLGRERGYRSMRIPGLLIVLY